MNTIDFNSINLIVSSATLVTLIVTIFKSGRWTEKVEGSIRENAAKIIVIEGDINRIKGDIIEFQKDKTLVRLVDKVDNLASRYTSLEESIQDFTEKDFHSHGEKT